MHHRVRQLEHVLRQERGLQTGLRQEHVLQQELGPLHVLRREHHLQHEMVRHVRRCRELPKIHASQAIILSNPGKVMEHPGIVVAIAEAAVHPEAVVIAEEVALREAVAVASAEVVVQEEAVAGDDSIVIDQSQCN